VTPPLLTYTQREASAALGVSVNYFRLHVLPELRVIRRGRRTLIPVREVERWAAEAAEAL
jgi:hypothetical protein